MLNGPMVGVSGWGGLADNAGMEIVSVYGNCAEFTFARFVSADFVKWNVIVY